MNEAYMNVSATQTKTEGQVLAEQLADLLQSKGVALTQSSRKLLDLCAHAWISEPVKLKDSAHEVDRSEMAKAVIAWASFEYHVVRCKDSDKPVDFFNWLYALAVSGRNVLENVMDKGF